MEERHCCFYTFSGIVKWIIINLSHNRINVFITHYNGNNYTCISSLLCSFQKNMRKFQLNYKRKICNDDIWKRYIHKRKINKQQSILCNILNLSLSHANSESNLNDYIRNLCFYVEIIFISDFIFVCLTIKITIPEPVSKTLNNVGVRVTFWRCRFRESSILDRQSNYWQHDFSLSLSNNKCNFVCMLYHCDREQFNW